MRSSAREELRRCCQRQTDRLHPGCRTCKRILRFTQRYSGRQPRHSSSKYHRPVHCTLWFERSRRSLCCVHEGRRHCLPFVHPTARQTQDPRSHRFKWRSRGSVNEVFFKRTNPARANCTMRLSTSCANAPPPQLADHRPVQERVISETSNSRQSGANRGVFLPKLTLAYQRRINTRLVPTSPNASVLARAETAQPFNTDLAAAGATRVRFRFQVFSSSSGWGIAWIPRQRDRTPTSGK